MRVPQNMIVSFKPYIYSTYCSALGNLQNAVAEQPTVIMNALSMGSGNAKPSVALKNANRIITTENITAPTEKRFTGMVKEPSAGKKGNTGAKVKVHIEEDAAAKGRKSLPKEDLAAPPVYCICREEERPGMIGCDYCDEWYHTQCLSLSKEEVQRLANENWSCPNCEFKKEGNIL